MSLENAIQELTKSNEVLIGLMKEDIELRRQGMATVATAINKVADSNKGKATAAPKAAAAAAAPADDASADEMKEAKKAIASYLSGTERAEERKARQAKILKLLSHKDIRAEAGDELVKDLKDINPAKLKAVIKNVTKFIADGDLTEAPAPEASDDDELNLD